MAVIDYDKWMKDTARFGLTRSPELKALDNAFLSYEKLGTAAAKKALETAFNTWKTKAGPGDAWKKSSRNSNRSAEKLAALLSGAGDEDSAFSQGRAPDFMHEELINARLGVLYLFSRLSVTEGIFKLLLGGGLSLATQGMKVGGVDKDVQSIFSKASKGGVVVGAVGNKLENALTPQQKPKNMYRDAAASPSVEAGPTATLVTSVELQRNAEAAEKAANTPTMQKIKEKVRVWFDMLVDKVMDIIRKKFGTVAGLAGTIKTIVRGCVAAFAAKAAPFVGAGLDLAAGVGKTLDAAVTRFRTWKEGKDVEVGDGHPTVVVESITRAMTLSLFQGLYQTLKGGGALAMDIVGFGAGGLVNLIVSAGELLIKFIWRLAETVRFNDFCGEARSHWENHLTADALHRRPFAFSEWYRGYALNIPLIAVLTLNTGICGDKMRYLTMFSGGGSRPLSSEAFQAGVRFLDNLKPWGAKYISDAGFNIRSAGDILVDRLVNQFATSHEREKTVFDQVIAVVTA